MHRQEGIRLSAAHTHTHTHRSADVNQCNEKKDAVSVKSRILIEALN